MRIGNELIGKPVYSITDGRHLGSVKDLYLDLELGTLFGIFLGHEGLIRRKARLIRRDGIAVFGFDAVLATGPDVVTDDSQVIEAQAWLKREDLQGRAINTAGGTRVGTVGDVLIDEEGSIVGYSLARAFVEGPVADRRMIMSEAIVDNGGIEGTMIVNLAKAEQQAEVVEVPAAPDEPPEAGEPAEIMVDQPAEEALEEEFEEPVEAKSDEPIEEI